MTFCQAFDKLSKIAEPKVIFIEPLVGNALLILIQNMMYNMPVEMLFISTVAGVVGITRSSNVC